VRYDLNVYIQFRLIVRSFEYPRFNYETSDCDLHFVHKGPKVKSINLKLQNSTVQKMGNICYMTVSDIYVGLIIMYAR
jgi:hypothetical protein